MKRRVAVAAVLALLAVAIFGYRRLSHAASIGAGYTAKELCSCIFVGGRSLDSCRPDVPQSMDRVQAELLPDGVRGFVTGLASRVARFEPGFGCTLR